MVTSNGYYNVDNDYSKNLHGDHYNMMVMITSMAMIMIISKERCSPYLVEVPS
jgi:hypothetical protein